MKEFMVALQFLTIIPVRLKAVSQKQVSRSTIFFSLVGYGIGLVLIAGYYILSFLGIHLYLLSFALVMMLIALTGGLHLDGLADTVDGFSGGSSSRERLAIMRDPHIGTMGVLSLISALLAKIFLLRTVPIPFFPSALLLMCFLSRWSMVLVMYVFPYARKEGKAALFMSGRQPFMFACASLITIVLAYAIWGFWGIVLTAIVAVAAVLFGAYCTRKIGGMTGDTIGATNEIIEIIIVAAIIIIGRSNPCAVRL